MTLREATRTIKELIGADALVTFEVISTINGHHETLTVKWYTSETRTYSQAFPSLEAAVEDACQVFNGAPQLPVDVVVA